MKQYTDSLPHDLYFAGMPEFAPGQITDKRVRDAVQLFHDTLETTGIKPDYVAVSMWDPAMLIVEALRKLGPSPSAEQVRAYLANLKGWVGAGGMYNFPASPQRGLDEKNVMVLRWDAAEQTWIGVSKPGGVPL
jgi:branched-chain amino acid transport system substrate-binding protein